MLVWLLYCIIAFYSFFVLVTGVFIFTGAVQTGRRLNWSGARRLQGLCVNVIILLTMFSEQMLYSWTKWMNFVYVKFSQNKMTVVRKIKLLLK